MRARSSLQQIILGPFETLAYFAGLLPLLAHPLHSHDGLDHRETSSELFLRRAALAAVLGLDAHLGYHAEVGVVTVGGSMLDDNPKG